MKHNNPGIRFHPHVTAEIYHDVSIGEETTVWQFASVIRGAVIGKRCTIGSCAIVDGAVLGDDCIISHGASINPGVRLGNRVFVGPNATICNDRWPTTDKKSFPKEKLLNKEIFTVVIGDRTSIGANAVILPGVVIGSDCMIAAGSVVGESLPDYSVHYRSGNVHDFLSVKKPRRVPIVGGSGDGNTEVHIRIANAPDTGEAGKAGEPA